MIEIKDMHSSPSKVNDHIWDIRDNIIQASIKVAYDQTHDQTSISHKHTMKGFNQNSKRDKKATLSLEAYDLYIFSPLGNKLPKSS